MSQVLLKKRFNPRFSFFADAEITLPNGTLVLGQLTDLSYRGCCIDTLGPISIGTKVHLRICDGTSSCELPASVIYVQSSGGLGVLGVGVLFGEMTIDQRATLNMWLSKVAASGPSPAD